MRYFIYSSFISQGTESIISILQRKIIEARIIVVMSMMIGFTNIIVHTWRCNLSVTILTALNVLPLINLSRKYRNIFVPPLQMKKLRLAELEQGFPGGSDGKESACNVGDPGLTPGLGRSPGEGKIYPLQDSGLENFMDYSPCGQKDSDMTVIFTCYILDSTYV